jgi:hypothetical protein
MFSEINDVGRCGLPIFLKDHIIELMKILKNLVIERTEVLGLF